MTKADIVNEIAKTTGIDKASVLAVVEQLARTYISVASAHFKLRNVLKKQHATFQRIPLS